MRMITLPTKVTPEIHTKMKRLSEESGQSVSNILREMVESFCDDIGIVPEGIA